MAYVFFIGGYFVGPQFSFRHFKTCLSKNKDGLLKIPLMLVLQKLVLACSLLIVVILNMSRLSTKHVLETEQFFEMPYIQRYWHWAVWGHLAVIKYCMVWTLAEGTIILSGIGYSGDSKGRYMFKNRKIDVPLNDNTRLIDQSNNAFHPISIL